MQRLNRCEELLRRMLPSISFPFRFAGSISERHCGLTVNRWYATEGVSFVAKATADKDSAERMAQNLDYCARIVKERDYENFVAAMLMPEATRPAIISSLAVNAEVSVVRQKIKRNSGVAGIYQLQFWRDAMRVWARQQKGLLPRQPAIECLKAHGTPHEDVDLLLKLVEARQATLGDRPFRTIFALEDNAVNIYGSLIRLWANALTRLHDNDLKLASDQTTFNNIADKLAKAVGIAVLLRGTLPLLKENVVLLPEDIMDSHGLNAALVFANKKPDALKRMVAELCQISYDHLESVRKFRADIDSRLRPALISSAFQAEYLTSVLRANDHNIFTTRLQQRSVIAKKCAKTVTTPSA